MLPRAPIAILALLAAAGATAAAGDTSATAVPSDRGAHASRTVRVAIKDDFFSPRSLKVRRGTRVRWVWRGRDRHDVTVRSGPTDFASPTKRRGTYTRKLRRSGTYRLICTRHDGMSMKLVVRRPR